MIGFLALLFFRVLVYSFICCVQVVVIFFLIPPPFLLLLLPLGVDAWNIYFRSKLTLDKKWNEGTFEKFFSLDRLCPTFCICLSSTKICAQIVGSMKYICILKLSDDWLSLQVLMKGGNCRPKSSRLDASIWHCWSKTITKF